MDMFEKHRQDLAERQRRVARIAAQVDYVMDRYRQYIYRTGRTDAYVMRLVKDGKLGKAMERILDDEAIECGCQVGCDRCDPITLPSSAEEEREETMTFLRMLAHLAGTKRLDPGVAGLIEETTPNLRAIVLSGDVDMVGALIAECTAWTEDELRERGTSTRPGAAPRRPKGQR